jgi:hypothetical protein
LPNSIGALKISSGEVQLKSVREDRAMLKSKTKYRAVAFAGAVMALAAFVPAKADNVDTGRSGSVGCGGSFTPYNVFAWTLRNFNETDALTITRMRIFDAQGGLRYDSLVSGLPLSLNGLLGPNNKQLGANQTTVFNSDQLQQQGVLVSGMPLPLQVLFDWTAQSRVVPLSATFVRMDHNIQPDGTRGAQNGLDIASCQNLAINK